jgi:hypothetical protein
MAIRDRGEILREMEKEKHVNTWEECEERLLQIKSQASGEVWFRGQSNACWGLATTLERQVDQITTNEFSYFIEKYWKLMLKIKPQIDEITGRTSDVPEWAEPPWPFEHYFRTNAAYGYMAYLRHHGFPSPLLDWSLSPEVAGYFAFSKPEAADRAAIYAFLERPPTLEFLPVQGPKICTRGSCNLETDERHSRQQSSYTVCVERLDNPERWKFVSHQRVFETRETGQIYKTTLPIRERVKTLKHLDSKNINAFSLLCSEDALMETLALREILLIGEQ